MNAAWLAPLKSRWSALGHGERRALSALACFLGVVLFYLLIWSPIENGVVRSRAHLASVQAQLAQVQAQAAQVETIRTAPRVEGPADAAGAVQQAAARNGLGEMVKRVDADGAGSARVQIEGVSFPALMALLIELQQTGLRAESATLERHSSPGAVNVRMLLQARGG